MEAAKKQNEPKTTDFPPDFYDQFKKKRKEQFERIKSQEHLSIEERKNQYKKSVRANRSKQETEEEQKKDRERKQLERAQQRLTKQYTFLYNKKNNTNVVS